MALAVDSHLAIIWTDHIGLFFIFVGGRGRGELKNSVTVKAVRTGIVKVTGDSIRTPRGPGRKEKLPCASTGTLKKDILSDSNHALNSSWYSYKTERSQSYKTG